MAVISDFFAWTKVFAGDHSIFVETPTPLVVRAIENRKAGAALDVGMGQGHNSVYLAAYGWNVTGFDPCEEAVRIAQSNAAKAGVTMHAVVARDDEFDYGAERRDLIVVTYVKELTAEDARILWRAPKLGGTVVYVNGADETNAVLKAFQGFRSVRFEDVKTNADWNPKRKMRAQRLIAQKDQN